MKQNTVPFELDLNEFPKDLLIEFIIYAHEKDLTFNQALVKLLEDFLSLENKNQSELPLQ
jgi:hypothetical protein